MPTLTFLALAAVVGTIGFVLLRGTRKVVDEKTGEITEIPALAADGQKPQAKPRADGSAEFAPCLLYTSLRPGGAQRAAAGGGQALFQFGQGSRPGHGVGGAAIVTR